MHLIICNEAKYLPSWNHRRRRRRRGAKIAL